MDISNALNVFPRPCMRAIFSCPHITISTLYITLILYKYYNYILHKLSNYSRLSAMTPSPPVCIGASMKDIIKL